MFKKVIFWGTVSGLVLLAFTTPLQARSFSAELMSQYSSSKTDAGDISSVSLSTQIHMEPVNDEFHPKAEATFLERSTNFTFSGQLGKRAGDDVKGVSLVAEFMKPSSRGYLWLSYLNETSDGKLQSSQGGQNPLENRNIFGFDINAERRTVGVGWFLRPQLLLRTTFGLESTSDGGEATSLSLEAKWVNKLLFHRTLTFEAGMEEIDHEHNNNSSSLSVAKTAVGYFFNRYSSVKFSASTVTGEHTGPSVHSIHLGSFVQGGDEAALQLSFRHFFNDVFAMVVRATQYDQRFPYGDGTEGAIAIIARF